MAFERIDGAATRKLIVSCVLYRYEYRLQLALNPGQQRNVHELFMSPFRKATICSMRLT
jgi:hypothetical protein